MVYCVNTTTGTLVRFCLRLERSSLHRAHIPGVIIPFVPLVEEGASHVVSTREGTLHILVKKLVFRRFAGNTSYQ